MERENVAWLSDCTELIVPLILVPPGVMEFSGFLLHSFMRSRIDLGACKEHDSTYIILEYEKTYVDMCHA